MSKPKRYTNEELLNQFRNLLGRVLFDASLQGKLTAVEKEILIRMKSADDPTLVQMRRESEAVRKLERMAHEFGDVVISRKVVGEGITLDQRHFSGRGTVASAPNLIAAIEKVEG